MADDTVTFQETAILSNQRNMDRLIIQGDSDIQKFYSDATVFVTGGSGFLGKQLIEKLLRSCQISKVYMLLRAKKGVESQCRLEKLLQDPVFNTLRSHHSNFADKIVAIDGDISCKQLGINEKDWSTLTNEVNLIFHLGATTKFDEPLKRATLINVRGTTEVIALGKACKQLRSLVHVSTAYSHATKQRINDDIDEKFYPSPMSPEMLISMVENMDENRLKNITLGFIYDWHNTYTFTKAVAEEAVRTMSDGLPICIIRPGIITSSYKEPGPGWIDSSQIYGVTGILSGMSVGMLHTYMLGKDVHLGFIPCDFVNNATIVAAWYTAINQARGGDDTKIYTAACFSRNSKLSATIKDMFNKSSKKLPSPSAVYYNFHVHVNSKIKFAVTSFFMHTLPAYVLDVVCLLHGRKRMFVNSYKKMNNMLNSMSFFMLNEWKFGDRNLEDLYGKLKDGDKIVFNFDITSLDWKEYITYSVMGIRINVLKDGLKNTDYALKKQFLFKYVHYLFVLIYCYGLWKFVGLNFKLIYFLMGLLSRTNVWILKCMRLCNVQI